MNILNYFVLHFPATCAAVEDRDAMARMPIASTCGDSCVAVIAGAYAFAKQCVDVPSAVKDAGHIAARQCGVFIDG
jgi:hypothetical protein